MTEGAQCQLMSMVTAYRRLRPHELVELRRLLAEKPEEAYGWVEELELGDEGQDVPPRGMDTDKAWAGLQHLLAKLHPPVDVISGGTPLTGQEWGYDSPRLLTVDQVADAARFLNVTPFASLARHYDPAELISAEIYPEIWDDDGALSYLEGYYTAIVALFGNAAADHEPILVWMS